MIKTSICHNNIDDTMVFHTEQYLQNLLLIKTYSLITITKT